MKLEYHCTVLFVSLLLFSHSCVPGIVSNMKIFLGGWNTLLLNQYWRLIQCTYYGTKHYSMLHYHHNAVNCNTVFII